MLEVLILVIVSKTLSFTGLTLTALFAWFNVHPFWFLFLLGNFILRKTRLTNINL